MPNRRNLNRLKRKTWFSTWDLRSQKHQLVVQYLLLGSIQPTANHWSFHKDEVLDVSPLAEIKHISNQILVIFEMEQEKGGVVMVFA